eukprot:TRINITY_DN2979_c0_g1_i1.p1 TRINITY_DN2979_c0_g1~~TRINITY_DN2979_c0_g1_i1.p1  ORF type:complete len:109 (-),score=2.06 TRINITY_DN2979_c0_g1_i1:612-938(-)
MAHVKRPHEKLMWKQALLLASTRILSCCAAQSLQEDEADQFGPESVAWSASTYTAKKTAAADVLCAAFVSIAQAAADGPIAGWGNGGMLQVYRSWPWLRGAEVATWQS